MAHSRLKEAMRRTAFGHNFDTDRNREFLREINEWYPKKPEHYAQEAQAQQAAPNV